MKDKLLYALAILLLTVALLGADAAAPGFFAQVPVREGVLSQKAPNRVYIDLSSNPTTGYSWTAEIEDEGIVIIREEFLESGSNQQLVGAGGVQRFQVSGNTPGTTSIYFRYARPWESEQPTQTLLYRLTVNDNLDVMIWGVEAEF